MFRRIRRTSPHREPDLRPGLLSLVCLLFILLPTLLITTSLQRLTALGVSLAGTEEGADPSPGSIRDLEVLVGADALLVRAEIRTLDVRAEALSGAWNETRIPHVDTRPDIATLRARLEDLARLDPERKALRIVPHAETPTSTLLLLMDAARLSPHGRLYPDIELAEPLSAEQARRLDAREDGL
jgi:hypothetical protein